MAKIVPAILENIKSGLADKMFVITHLPGVERIQVDFCDGVFVPTKTLPVREIGTLNSMFAWEAHLMIEDAHDFLDYKIAGFRTIIVHYEAFSTVAALDESLHEIIALGFEPAIAINPETSVSVLRYFTDTIKQFTLLSVVPGKQGQSFLPESVDRLRELRQIAPNAILEIDGGITLETLPSIAEYADYVVVGSAIFKSGSPGKNFEDLVNTLHKLPETKS